ncbi:hypothetical protein [Candidatus Poriferisodalis sp.]|uniref:hypothetical protein n=1 Tax=Candidatus Poriferisodalis sp. TaxID=3101277 RepID=UPI003B011279
MLSLNAAAVREATPWDELMATIARLLIDGRAGGTQSGHSGGVTKFWAAVAVE